MAYIDWKGTYDIGFKLIDDQHKSLVQLLNELHDAHSKGTGQHIIGESLNKMVEYTHYHFDTEKKLFDQYEYDKSEGHLSEHKEFTDKIDKFLEESKSGNLLLSLKTIDFLKDWTITHILGTDKEFGEFVREKELGGMI